MMTTKEKIAIALLWTGAGIALVTEGAALPITFALFGVAAVVHNSSEAPPEKDKKEDKNGKK